MQYRKIKSNRIMSLVTQPFLWLPLPFFIMLDLVIEIYHQICFPIYHIPIVKRSEYIMVMDRQKLQYLDGWEKLGCMYCGYINGLLAYMVVIASETEKFWCGIMHEEKLGFRNQSHQKENNFAKFNDKSDLINKYGD